MTETYRYSQSLASCTHCGCLVYAARRFEGCEGEIYDPRFLYQRLVRSEIGTNKFALWAQPFGLGQGVLHQCPPGEYPPRAIPFEGEKRHGQP